MENAEAECVWGWVEILSLQEAQGESSTGEGADILIQEDRPTPETEVWNFDPTWPRQGYLGNKTERCAVRAS